MKKLVLSLMTVLMAWTALTVQADDCVKPTVSTAQVVFASVRRYKVDIAVNNALMGKVLYGTTEVQGTKMSMDEGVSYSLTATALSTEYEFSKWIDAAGNTIGTTSILSYAPTAATKITAVFRLRVPMGAIGEKAVFSVSATEQVFFSKGNLIYNEAGDWSFAEDQFEYGSYFGYGTSGATAEPTQTSTTSEDYICNIDITKTNNDWGWYNSIENGGGETKTWYVLTADQWEYLFKTRANASSKYGWATVNDIKGIVVLPDSWTLPAGASFTSGMTATNSYTIAQWAVMEAAGALFLPAAGRKYNNTVSSAGSYGYYWSGTKYSTSNYSTAINFRSGTLTSSSSVKVVYGCPVRLVQTK